MIPATTQNVYEKNSPIEKKTKPKYGIFVSAMVIIFFSMHFFCFIG